MIPFVNVLKKWNQKRKTLLITRSEMEIDYVVKVFVCIVCKYVRGSCSVFRSDCVSPI